MYCLYDQNQSNSNFFFSKGKKFYPSWWRWWRLFWQRTDICCGGQILTIIPDFSMCAYGFFYFDCNAMHITLRNDLNNIGCPRLSGHQFTIILAIVLGLMKISCPQRNTTYLYFFNENIRELDYQHVFSRHSYLNTI